MVAKYSEKEKAEQDAAGTNKDDRFDKDKRDAPQALV